MTEPAAALPASTAPIRPEITASLPTFVIIGAMRCGTTSVHNWLRQLPDVSMSRKKELSFFVSGKHGNWDKGLDWYAGNFDPSKLVRGESSPKYTKDPIFPGVPERLHATLPEARLLYLVRDPIARLLSHYTVIALQGWEHRSLADALANLDSNEYVIPGLYSHQLDRYRRLFADDRIMVVALEDLQRDPAAVMRRILPFLGLPADAVDTLDLRAQNVSRAKRAVTPFGRKVQQRFGRRALHFGNRFPLVRRALFRPMVRPSLDPGLRAGLEQVYAPDVAALRASTGQAFSDWSI